jgi:CRISPR-associated protein (TIGR02710 family)
MSSKILFITVGGSFQPIVTSIRNLNPDRVIFICSGGNQGSDSQVIGHNKPCEVRKDAEVIDKLPNIPEQLNLGDKFQAERDLIVVNNPDDLSECYQRITEKIRQVQQESSNAQFMADYTGGTKTMSVSLGLAALDYQLTVYLTTTTTRQNLIRVERGERVQRATTTSVRITRTLEQLLPPLLAQYNYPAAIAELNNLLTTMELSFNDSQQIQKQLDLCYGFNLWDCFEHSEAWEYLSPYLKDEKLRPHLFFLKRVMGNREKVALAVNDKFTAPEKMKGHNYEIVEDLLLNAERRATVERYDDAVARLYRALELFAQVRLFNEYELITGNLELDKLPQSLRPNYEKLRSDKGYIQIGLRQAYLLLTELKDTGLSELYAKYESGIFDKLQIRNYSILAHGLSPINQSEYKKFAQIIKEFIREGLQNCVSKKDTSLLFSQFPTAF